ncbi:cytochrome c-type biogenesis protein [Pannonibacter indicus]|jgi:cytochrome c-type biogenesis protein CcmH|uniref:Cytochrome c-type biogenesis protein n=1 Tax=Pannonibacter indicus TaxID=466044 RepID=A0A0K6HZX1_9HYPH|nr:cytochrome c-type biogenesis protein [Pannonibacter indicus]CUA96430.1 Cytochrome c-type biogenesis protein CcmH/NrfF [Pannonibacter indicus]
MRRFLASLLMVFSLCGTALAIGPDEILPDPALEARARELSAQLRCMVCQNQSIDDSDAPLAKDLRVLVRERLVAGDSNEAVIDYLVSRYGEFVLLKPRIGWNTIFLWASAPLALFAGGIAVLVASRRQKRRAAIAEAEPLTAAEEAELAAILKEEPEADVSGQGR